MLKCLLVGGEIPQSGIDVAEGLLVLAGIAMVIISLIVAGLDRCARQQTKTFKRVWTRR